MPRPRGLVQEALIIDRALRPADPRSVSQSLNNLGNILLRQRRYVAAESVHREAYALRRAAFGDDNAETANSLVNIAAALGGQDRFVEAKSLYRQGLAIKRARLGARHVDVATDEAGFARLLHLEGDDRAAEALYRQSIATHRALRRPPSAHRPRASAGELPLARGTRALPSRISRKRCEASARRSPRGIRRSHERAGCWMNA
jgi:tetratricopeptide (TPR) repeat protein